MPARYSSNKDVNRLVRHLVAKGWTFQRRSRHGRLRAPHGTSITVPCTPGDYRAWLNLRAEVRRGEGGCAC